MASDQLAQNQEIPAERGVILDARGQLLATSVQVYSVYATPPQVSDPELEANVLAGLLQLPKADLVSKLSSAKAWLWLRRRVDPLISDTIRALALPGIGLLPETLRVYPTAGAAPGSTLAAQLIGYVYVNGTGQYGVEGSQNNLLTGTPGHVVAEEDIAGRQIADSVQIAEQPVNGADVKLTIDSGVQHILEAQLYDAYTRNHAHGAGS